jgi:hypothetical protein
VTQSLVGLACEIRRAGRGFREQEGIGASLEMRRDRPAVKIIAISGGADAGNPIS